MSIMKWKNIDEMLSLRDEIDRLFNQMFEKTSFHSWQERYDFVSSGTTSPEFSIYEKDNNVVIQAQLPGFEKSEIKVSVSGNLLAIGSEVNREREFRGNDAYRYQKSYGSFCRIMELPSGTDINGMRTSFRNGLLEVIIPKTGYNSTSTSASTSASTSTSKSTPPQIHAPLSRNPALSSNLLPDKSDEE